MKKILNTIFFLLSSLGMVFGQQISNSGPDATTRAAQEKEATLNNPDSSTTQIATSNPIMVLAGTETEQLRKDLNLNAAEATKVAEINIEYQIKLESLKRNLEKYSESEVKEKLITIKNNHKNEIVELLSPEQKMKYKSLYPDN